MPSPYLKGYNKNLSLLSKEMSYNFKGGKELKNGSEESGLGQEYNDDGQYQSDHRINRSLNLSDLRRG